MKKTKLQDYRRQVESYFHMEFSDVPLEQVLLRLPEKYTVKVAKRLSITSPHSNTARTKSTLEPRFVVLSLQRCSLW